LGTAVEMVLLFLAGFLIFVNIFAIWDGFKKKDYKQAIIRLVVIVAVLVLVKVKFG